MLRYGLLLWLQHDDFSIGIRACSPYNFASMEFGEIYRHNYPKRHSCWFVCGAKNMTKGNPWPLEDERNLRTWFTQGTTDLRVLAFSLEGRYTKRAIRQKLIKLGLIEQQQTAANGCCSSELELPEEMPSVEEALKILCAALKALEMPGLDRREVLRLRSIISGVKTYKELLVDYRDYRGLEQELIELRDKYNALAASKKYRHITTSPRSLLIQKSPSA